MRFAVLGPLEVDEGGRPLSLGGPKQRAVLAILLLHANEVVSRDRLIDGVWGEHPPASPSQTLDTYVSRLRKQLGAERLVRHPGGGYVLHLGPGELDLERFEELAAAGSPAEALALWRGPALADLLFEPFAAAEAERLEDRRLDVLEERIELELAAGGSAELVQELERLVRDHPLRERLIGQLMQALYRAGRQAAALEAYRAARRGLVGELGIEPGPHLRELERRILAHDPTLQPQRRPLRKHRNRRLLLAGVALGLALAAAVAIVVATRGVSGSAIAPPQTSRLVAVAIGSHALLSGAALPSSPAAITVAAGSLWLADPNDQAVLRVDPATGGVVDRIAVGGEPGALAAGGGSVWAASTLGGTIERIDPTTETVSQTIHLGQANTSTIAFGHGGLWVADTTDDALIELDATTGSPTRTLTLGIRPTALAVGDEAIWAVDYDTASVVEVDLASGQTVATIHVGNGPSALALGQSALWVANSLDSTVTEIDPATDAVLATIPVGSGPAALAVADGAVWVANEYSGTVSRLDARRAAVASTIAVGGLPVTVAVAAGRLWIGSSPSAATHRGGTLVLASSQEPLSLDPALYNETATPQFTGLAYDTLVTFARTGGPGGLRLVPDLAVALPAPTNGGTTYAFRLRSGIRYSDGQLLHAADFRRAFERLFRLDSPGIDYYTAIVGASACARHAHRCDLSRGVVTDDRTGTIVFHLARPDPDFLFKLTEFAFSAPLPPGTPDRDLRFRPPAGTGPYRIEAADPHRITFARNRYFREWSHAAQPNGNPNRIVWRFSSSHQQTISWVAQGRADWTFDLISPAELGQIRARHPSLLHANPIDAVDFIPLNTHLAPFDDIRVRQALNLAVDRRRIARMYGGLFVAAPTCQPLVPGLTGYRRYCPYTADASRDGTYHGPALARAKRLVAESGTRGERIDVWGATDEFVVPPQEAFYIGDVLRSLGYHVRVHSVRFASITEAIRRRIQLSVDGDWVPDYPAPSSYLPQFFGCNGGTSNGYVCNPGLDTAMAHALTLQLTSPAEAAALWRRVDQQITDEAYWVPTVDPRAVELVSTRLRNYEFSPVWGFIADQAWLR